jgi:hypothetical protein
MGQPTSSTVLTNQDLLRIGARSFLFAVALWLVVFEITVWLDWPLASSVFLIGTIVPMTLSANPTLTHGQRLLLVFCECLAFIVLLFAVSWFLYPALTHSMRALFGALALGVFVGILSMLITPIANSANFRR